MTRNTTFQVGMMEKPERCPECGARLPPDAPLGVCPQCLLQAGLGAASIDNAAQLSLMPDTSGSEAKETLFASETPTAENEAASGLTYRHFGEYELIEEIARGGMGVVYKARQVRLNRIVAVKMIRAGQLASEQDVERFYIEAEAAASLDHSGIVPIFEVGQEDDQHYFSMAFVEGPSLANLLQDGPLAPTEAAELTMKIAAAVDYAHSHGVIHRDLKPANILLDGRQSDAATPNLLGSLSRAAIGEPRVTDFGLAKHTNRRSDLTETGQVLGTPSYMPPEQAQGKTDKVNEKSDVYSLGAILYASLTGRPPFQAASPVDTLMQVLEQDPVEPRQLNPGIPRDLETICLKCLEKEPERRYASAQALNDELQRFLGDEPILARPMSLTDRGIRWLRRKGGNAAVGFLAMAATAIFAALAVASWYSYSQWQLGLLSLDTDRPPLVAEFFDTNGQRIAAAETIPTAEPVSLPADEYLLRVSAKGRLSETYRAQLQRDEHLELELDLDDQLHWPSLAIERQFDLVQLDGRTDIIQLTDEGIKRFDGEERWTVPLQNSESPVLKPVTGFTWPWPPSLARGAGRGKYNLRPRIVSTSDLNGDDADDFIIAARHQAWVMGVSGANGEILWLAARGADTRLQPQRGNYPRLHSAVVGIPKVAADLDDDGVADLITTFADTRGTLTTANVWVEAISAATGKTIWKFDLQPSWLSLPPGVEIPYHFRLFTGAASGVASTGGGTSSSGRELTRGGGGRPQTERHGSHVYIPDEVHICQRGDTRLAVFTAGVHVIALDESTGKLIAPATKLTHRPTRAAVLAEVDADGCAELVHVGQKLAGPVQGSVELSVWSVNHQRSLFRKTLQADYWMRPNFMTPRPRWPMAADLNGDGRDEIIVSSGSSAYSFVWPKSGWGNLDVIDGTTGESRWQRQFRTMDEQVDWFLPGPDINGDGHRDVFVATLLYKDTELYIDCLSGKDGVPLWSESHALNKKHDRNREFWVGELRWWNGGRDGWPQLVVPVLPDPSHRQKSDPSSIYVISAGTGKLRGIGQGMESVRLADVDGDGLQELLSFRPTDGFEDGGALDVIRPSSAEAWRRIGDTDWQSADDLDRDTFPDLIQSSRNGYLEAVSGSDGHSLWQTQLPARSHGQKIVPLGADLNGDNIPDLIAVPASNHVGSSVYTPFHAISGRDGRLLWTADIECNVASPNTWVQTHDLDQDGQMEVVLVNKLDLGLSRRTSFSSRDGQLWLMALSGRSGAVKWKHALSGVDASGAPTGTSFDLNLEQDWLRVSLGDLNDDGVIDIVTAAEDPSAKGSYQMQAVSGDDGATLWGHRLPMARDVGYELMQSAPLVADVDGDGRQEVILMETETDASNKDRNRNTVVRLKSLDRETGTTRWQWQTQAHFSNAVGRGPLSDEYLRQRRPTPKLLQLSGKAESMICLNLWGASSGVVLLDHEGREQSKIPLANGDKPGVWPLDVNGDGNDDLVVYTNELILAINPIGDKKPVWKLPVKRSSHDSIVQLIPADKDQSPIVVFKTGASIRGLDALTGKLAWKCDGPHMADLPDDQDRVISLIGSTEAGLPTVRGVVYTMGDVTVCRRPRAVATQSRMVEPVAAQLDGNVDDPRLLRDLPWMAEFVRQAERPLKAIVTLAWFMMLSALLIVVPALYVRHLARSRTWSLAMFLLLPVVVGLIMFSLTMPTPQSFEKLVPLERFVMATVMLPSVVLPVFWTLWAIRLEWRRLSLWLAATVVLSFAFATAIVSIGSLQSGPGMGYSWKGWYTILVYGAYWIGWGMIAVGCSTWFWGIIKRCIRRPGARNAEADTVAPIMPT